MAKPIKPTPTLTGKIAMEFHNKMENNRSIINPKEKHNLLEAIKTISIDKPKS